MKTKFSDLLQITAAILITGSMAYAMSPQPVVDDIQAEEHVTVSVEEHKPDSAVVAEKVEKKKPAKEVKKTTWRDNPNKCDQKKQWIAAEEPFECIDKPKPAPTASVARTVAPSVSVGSGSCAAEIKKYDWNHTVAYNVMMAESGGSAGIVNNNPATRDYSVGCFQVNLYGANARYRPSEAALKNAATNVQWAYNNYVANGHSFIGQWGVCRHISCY